MKDSAPVDVGAQRRQNKTPFYGARIRVKPMRFVSLFSAIALSASLVSAQKPAGSPANTASLVSLDLRVFGADETAITTLTKDDFSIFEDGQRRDILGFESVDTPYSILLLVDRSISMENDWMFLQPAIARNA
jgi:hypothetical protein